ncbi:MAG: PHP-associated domain-containing protein [Gemmatimonadota bacterium]
MTPHRRTSALTIRVDLHTHTCLSPDASLRPEELVQRASDAGLGRIAVTDHGQIDGALEARELAPDLVIVGEEIRCLGRTELIGLFLSERIPMGLPIEEVVERIRDQDGVVYAPHPYAYLYRPGWHLRRAIAVADVVEVFNARAFLSVWNRTADSAARANALPRAASSDAHFPFEIGRAHTEMSAFTSASGFLAAMHQARPVGLRLTHPGAHVASLSMKVARLAAAASRRPFDDGRRTVPASG